MRKLPHTAAEDLLELIIRRYERASTLWHRLHEALLAELRRRGRLDQRWTVVDSASVRAVRGGKNWTEPNRSPQGGLQASPHYRCARRPARRAGNGGQCQRHHPTRSACRRLARRPRPERPAPPPPGCPP